MPDLQTVDGRPPRFSNGSPWTGFGGQMPVMPQQQQMMPMLTRGSYLPPAAQGQMGYGTLPPRFGVAQPQPTGRMLGRGTGGMGGISRSGPIMPQAQQQGGFPFQLPDYSQMGLGNFYTPHGPGDAQNVPNQGPMATFVPWQNSQWGQTPSQYMSPGQRPVVLSR